MEKILYILLNTYADHEWAFLSQAVNCDEFSMRQQPKYDNCIVSLTMEPVRSAGGLRVLPDYTFETMPDDYAAMVLIGGFGWFDAAADAVAPYVKKVLDAGKIVGAICNASSWMAKHGFLNEIKHTGNGINQLQMWGGANYTNEVGYRNEQAVADGNVVTANGSAHIEFACRLMSLLKIESEEWIARYEYFYKTGLAKICTPQPRFKFNTVGVFTTDNRRTVDFYTQAFGFATEWDGEQPNVEMTLGESRLILFPREAFEQMSGCKYSYPEGLNGTVELSFDVPSMADVDKEYDNAVALGAKGVMAPATMPWGQRTCYVADPDGNLIEISSFVG